MEVPDLTGGDFEHLTISGQLRVIEETLDGAPAILIGSSLGGYLAALYASRHPEISRLLLMAPGFGFPRRWPESIDPARLLEWKQTGWLSLYNYARKAEARVHYQLLLDSQQYDDYPAVAQPTLIFHGLRDNVVPYRASQEFAGRNPHATLELLDSGHELTDVLEHMYQRSFAFIRGQS